MEILDDTDRALVGHRGHEGDGLPVRWSRRVPDDLSHRQIAVWDVGLVVVFVALIHDVGRVDSCPKREMSGIRRCDPGALGREHFLRSEVPGYDHISQIHGKRLEGFVFLVHRQFTGQSEIRSHRLPGKNGIANSDIE